MSTAAWLPVPEYILIVSSPQQAYYTGWLLTPEEHAELLAAEPPMSLNLFGKGATVRILLLLSDALDLTAGIELRYLGAEQLSKLKGESSE